MSVSSAALVVDSVPTESHILIVDDHLTVVEALRFVFQMAGFENLDEATSCQQARLALRVNPPQVMVLDLSLPDGNGLDLLRYAKNLGLKCAVVVHSFCQSDVSLLNSFRHGACGFVAKGSDKNELLTAVAKAALGQSAWTTEQASRIEVLPVGAC